MRIAVVSGHPQGGETNWLTKGRGKQGKERSVGEGEANRPLAANAVFIAFVSIRGLLP